MKLLITDSVHFIISSDGTLWTQNAANRYDIWTRYLDVFDQVQLLVRAKLHSSPPDGWVKASGPDVIPIPIPDFVGPAELAKNYVGVKRAIGKALLNAEAIQLRLPCVVGGEVWSSLPSYRPYSIEVLADPYDDFAPGSVKHPLRPFFRWWFTRQLQQQCDRACAASYVTKYALQQRYPCPNYSVGVSDVNLPDETFVSAFRPLCQEVRTFTLVFVGSLAQLYKAPDILIDAVAACVEEGLDLNLMLVGDGKYRVELEARAAACGLEKQVFFTGQLASSDAVREKLDQADLFVLPSRMEGLPRAMVEAMGRALPCIGSTVGGIPELLPLEDLVSPGDVNALASKIREIVTNPERMAQMSMRNLEKAKEYRKEILYKQQIEFYRYVREKTEQWLKVQKG